ncbi:hypothetical protein [Lactobacillus sp.]|uniref:DUF6994 family protein n=1 Tax=Lactobacillus sp. TaxID=1591 RepID=UPI001994F42A|nr:hypothetical protein [Lactobacillus sp.]MBD5429272.1 hypothetical protein [Lactobacillus sp.]
MGSKNIRIKGYQENVKRLTLFYKSDFYQELMHEYPNYLHKITDTLYEDGDLLDKSLYEALSYKYGLPIIKKRSIYGLSQIVNGDEIVLGADIICGYKSLIKYYPDFDKWIKAYSLIRSKINLHYLWPRHNLPTINTLRYTIYKDRIDYTLFDLKNYFAGNKTLMMPAYNNLLTQKWLSQFHDDFALFINNMKLNMFVDKEYNVLNIATQFSKVIEEIPPKSEINKSIPLYIEGILCLVRAGVFD